MSNRRVKLKNPSMGISGGYTYVHHETGVIIGPETSIYDLHIAVRDYDRAQNFGPTPKELIEAQVCARSPEGCRQATPDEIAMFDYGSDQFKSMPVRPAKPRSLNFKDVVAATRNLSRWLVSGRQKVDVFHAEARAQTCLSYKDGKPCPKHSDFKDDASPGCCGGNKLLAAVNAVVGKGAFPSYENVKVCQVCGCSLKAKVQLPLEYLKGLGEELPDNCWIVQETKENL